MKNKFIALFSNEKCKLLLWDIVVLLTVLLIAVMAIPPDTSIFMYLTGEKSKLELIKIIGWGISGLIAILGVMGLLQRAAAQDEQNKIMREGQLQERIKAAGDRLSSEHASVRIASFNDFYYLAIIEPNLRGYSFNTLCLHLRQTTKDKNYQKEEKASET